jgi:hypothetical protein
MGGSRPTPGGGGIAQVGGAPRSEGGILLVGHLAVLAEVLEPSPQPIGLFDSGQIASIRSSVGELQFLAPSRTYQLCLAAGRSIASRLFAECVRQKRRVLVSWLAGAVEQPG